MGRKSKEEKEAEALEAAALEAGEGDAGGEGEELEPAAAAAAPPDEETTKWTDAGDVDGVPVKVRTRIWEGKPFEIRIYLVQPLAGSPGRYERIYQEKICDTEVDENWLQERGYIGSFQCMRQWKEGKKDFKMQCGYYKIGRIKTAALSVTPEPNGVQASGGTPPPAQVLTTELMEEAFLRKMALYKNLFAPLAGTAGVPPGTFGQAALEESFERRLKSLDQREAALIMRESKPPAKAKESDSPEWLDKLMDEFLPVARKYLHKLTRSDAVGRDYRAELTADPKFLEIWSDTAKKAKAVRAIVGALGEPGETLARLIESEMSSAA